MGLNFNKYGYVILLATILLVPNMLRSQSKIKDIVTRHYKEGRFNGTVCVYKKGKIVSIQSRGKANEEFSIPNSTQTKYRIASLTKQFTAMGIYLLQKDRKLNTSDTIGAYIDGLPFGGTVTIDQLIRHSSGVKSITDLPSFYKVMGNFHTVNSLIDTIRQYPLEFVPGSKFKYSNSGYILLGKVIETVSRMSFEEFLKQRIFGPLGMENSGLEDPFKVVREMATGYSYIDNQPTKSMYINPSYVYAAGAIYSNVNDLIKWHKALRDNTLLSPKEMEAYYTPGKDGYCAGWIKSERYDRTIYEHNGGINGFTSKIIRIPSEDICIIILRNMEGNGLEELSFDLLKNVLGIKEKQNAEIAQQKEANININALKQYPGKYQMEQGPVFDIKEEKGKLFAKLGQQNAYEIYPKTDKLFFYKVVDATIEFVWESGVVSHLILHQNGAKIKAYRLSSEK